LKFDRIKDVKPVKVAPFAGVWIEIRSVCERNFQSIVAPFAGVWIEIGI